MPKFNPRPQGPTPPPLRPIADMGALDTTANAPAVPDAWAASQERLTREKKATTSDYLGSMWRQDGLVDGFMAHLAGSNLEPDPSYNPFTDSTIQEMQQGIWPEFQNELYGSTSRAHAGFMRDRLLQKQEDLTRLNDMGTAGTVGRFAFNAVLPDQLLIGMSGGWAARGVTAYKTSRAARVAKDATALARLEATVGAAAGTASRASSKGAIATGVGLGAAENAAYEKVRQDLNYERDSGAVLEAALMGAAITAPFAVAGSRAAARSARVLDREVEVIQALRAVDEGGTLTPQQGRLLADMNKANRLVADIEAGRVPASEAEKALDALHGPHEPDEVWMQRFGDRIRAETRDYIEQNFPSRDGRATGRAAPSPAQRAQMDAAVDLETKTHFPDKAPAGPELETAMGSAFKKALKEREKLRKALDLEALDEATASAKRAERSAAWDALEAEAAARKKADEDRLVNSYELALADQDPLSPPPAKPVPPPPEAPVVRAAEESWVGKEVSWMGPEGETLEGAVTRWNADLGKLIVKTSDGMKAVRPDHLDQFTSTPPEGFGGGQSVGAAQVLGTQIDSLGSQRTAMATVKIGGREVPIRFDYYAILNGSPLKSVRELTFKLIKDAIGNDKFDAQAMTASEWKHQLKRTVAGTFQVDAKASLKAAMKDLEVPFWKESEFAKDFYRLTTESTYDPTILDSIDPKMRPHVAQASAAMKKVYSSMLRELKAAGVKGADQIAPDDLYTNRIWHHGNLREAAEKHGEDSVVSLLAQAIVDKKGVVERMRRAPGTTELRDTLTNTVTHEGRTDAELLREKASRFLRTIKALEFSPALREVALAGRDMATLRGELKALGVHDTHIDDLVDLMFEVRPQDGDAGRAANLKYRFQLDQSTELMTRAGTLRLSDLFETDARVLVDTYVGNLAGHVGLAKHGITSQADWMRALKSVEDEGAASLKSDGGRIARDVQMLQDLHRHITGRPMSEASFSYSARVANAARAYTRSVMLPQLGISSAFEMGKAVAMFGFGNLLRQMPALRTFLRNLRQGHLPDEGLAQQIRLMTGFGNEMASSYWRAAEIDSGFMGQKLSAVENTANKLSHIADRLSGNASFTSLTKQMSAMMAVQEFSNHAMGKKLSAKKVERWVAQGLNADDLEEVMAAFKEHSGRDAKGTLEAIDYEAWQQASPKTYEQFQTFLARQVRDAIQDHDIGETMPFMHSQLGKLFGELKTFFLVAHAKNFLKQLAFRDATALHVWTIGFVAESLAYMTQTAINYPTELDKRLTPEAIAKAAYFRMSSMGTASLLTEFGYNLATGGESLVNEGTTANTDNRTMWRSPSMVVASRLGSALPTLGGLGFGTDETTKSEAKSLVGAIPLMRLYGLNTAAQYWANTFPTNDPEKSRTAP